MNSETHKKPNSGFPGLPHRVLVGTHRKTGTEWMTAAFFKIREHYGIDLDFQYHSQFDPEAFTQPFRGVHLIRDPRDVVISGCFFNLRSDEKWLQRPREDFQGLTYQQKINSFDSFDDQLIFEMENVAANQISAMLGLLSPGIL